MKDKKITIVGEVKRIQASNGNYYWHIGTFNLEKDLMHRLDKRVEITLKENQ